MPSPGAPLPHILGSYCTPPGTMTSRAVPSAGLWTRTVRAAAVFHPPEPTSDVTSSHRLLRPPACDRHALGVCLSFLPAFLPPPAGGFLLSALGSASFGARLRGEPGGLAPGGGGVRSGQGTPGSEGGGGRGEECSLGMQETAGQKKSPMPEGRSW